MKLDEFRNLVRSEFGQNLKHATPGNVREFLDRIENEVFSEQVTNRIVLNEPCTSYEEVIKDFFTQMLELPPRKPWWDCGRLRWIWRLRRSNRNTPIDSVHCSKIWNRILYDIRRFAVVDCTADDNLPSLVWYNHISHHQSSEEPDASHYCLYPRI